MAFIPEDKLLEIKDAARIEEVVGQYVKLTQKGKNLLGLCPFHADTQPSFTVAPDKGIFHCFGCGAGGNVFSFLMQHQRLSFPEAVEELAKRYGIQLTFKDLGPEGAKQTRQRQVMQEINGLAAAFFETTLKSEAGKSAREYLVKRGLTPEVIQAFHMGYAPDEWDALRRHLQGRGKSLEAARDVGLVVPRQHGGFYDRFRNRIIFPILDRHGKVMAFGGRIIGPGEPKYLNSPESPLYSKGRQLYGLPQAADALRLSGVAMVVEGYLDLIALHTHGVANVLATLGTALTREQVRLLKSLADKVVLVFDGDAAGAKAARRALPLFAQEGVAVRVLPLPAGQDPDSYCQAHGADLFRDPWEAAQPWFAYLVSELISAHGRSIEGRVRIVEELKPYFQSLADPVEQGLWLRFAAERLSVDEADLRGSLASWGPAAAARLGAAARLDISLEKKLLRWVLCHPETACLEDLEAWAGEFEDPDLGAIMALIIQSFCERGGLDHGLLIQRAESERLKKHICELTLEEEEFRGKSADLVASEWRQTLDVRRLKKASQLLKERMAAAAAGGGSGDLVALQVQKQEIDRQLESLKNSGSAKGETG